MKEFKKIINEIQKLDDIHLYDATHADDRHSLPADGVFKIIEANRQKRRYIAFR